jgi:hypothetical protein
MNITIRSISDLCNGIVRHPLRLAVHVFTGFSVLFTIIRGITHFVQGVKIEGPVAFAVVVLISVVYGLKKIWKPSQIEIMVPNTSTTIEVLFGDLFAQDGVRAIAVSEFFDSQLGKPVSDKSLHGIFLKKCFGGHPESFDKQVNEQLVSMQAVPTAKREGKTNSYAIGTTVLVTADQDRYIAFALAKAEPDTCKAYSDVTMMWTALHQLWQRARIETNGHPVNVPLVGSGLSGMGLPTRDLLNLIILSAITETKARQVTNRIRIVLHRDRFEELDLRDVKTHWEE